MEGTEAMDHVRDEMAKAKDGYTAYMGELMTAWHISRKQTPGRMC